MRFPQTFECHVGDVSDIWEIGHRISPSQTRPKAFADLDSNYHCTITVAGPTPIHRPVTEKTADMKRFRSWLTWQETATLPVGEHQVSLQLVNQSLMPELVKEVHFTLRMLPQVSPNPV